MTTGLRLWRGEGELVPSGNQRSMDVVPEGFPTVIVQILDVRWF